MASDTFFFAAVVVFLGVIGTCSSEYCTERYYSRYGTTTRTIHCSFGCCGSYHDQYCCVSSTGFIVGIVFACIFTIAVITAVICCCIKKKGARGRIIGPSVVSGHPHHHNTHNVFIVPSGPMPPAYSADHTGMYPPPPAYPSQVGGGYGAPLPPAYGQSSVQPPPYYPPTSAVKYPQQLPSLQQQQQQQHQPPQYQPPPPNPFAAVAGTSNQ